MKHLSRVEFIDLIESAQTLPPERLRHLERCEECRAEAEALGAMRAAALEDPAPEPSPLFWDHFSARVSERVRSESAPIAATGWFPPSFATWAAAGAVAVLLVTTAVLRTTLQAPAASNPVPATPTVASQVAEPIDDLETDEAWAVVREAAADLNWEDADKAGITAHPGDVEDVALQLTAAERVELARLLDADLKRNGA
jgi:hypothetical protein